MRNWGYVRGRGWKFRQRKRALKAGWKMENKVRRRRRFPRAEFGKWWRSGFIILLAWGPLKGRGSCLSRRPCRGCGWRLMGVDLAKALHQPNPIRTDIDLKCTYEVRNKLSFCTSRLECSRRRKTRSEIDETAALQKSKMRAKRKEHQQKKSDNRTDTSQKRAPEHKNSSMRSTQKWRKQGTRKTT